MSYERVLPRDLFNEAKLLKCLGFLTLHIHDCKISGINFDFEGDAFEVELNDNGLTVSNLRFYLSDGTEINFFTPYNSKSNFPLEAEINYEYTSVFTDSGEYTNEFLELLKTGE